MVRGPGPRRIDLLSGKVPRIIEAFAIEPARDARGDVRRLSELDEVKLLDSISVNPRIDDFFRKVIEERKRPVRATKAEKKRRDKGLKVIAVASSYGILAQMDGLTCRRTVRGCRSTCSARSACSRRRHASPNARASISSADRRADYFRGKVPTRDAGAQRYGPRRKLAMEDTDSMAIVATEKGGLVPCPGGPHAWGTKERKAYRGPNARAAKEAIRALSFAQVDAIIDRFTDLNPYDRSIIPDSILKLEDINFDKGVSRQVYCYAISSKRYCLAVLDAHGEPQIARDPKGNPHCSEHGLGHLLHPVDPDSEKRDWIEQTWRTILREHIGLPVEKAGWLTLPALTRLTVSSPLLWQPFERNERELPYSERVKPFNFLLAAHVAEGGFPMGAETTKFFLVAPYTADQSLWLSLPWRNIHVHSGHTYPATTDPDRRLHHPDYALLDTYETVLVAFRLHSEPRVCARTDCRATKSTATAPGCSSAAQRSYRKAPSTISARR